MYSQNKRSFLHNKRLSLHNKRLSLHNKWLSLQNKQCLILNKRCCVHNKRCYFVNKQQQNQDERILAILTNVEINIHFRITNVYFLINVGGRCMNFHVIDFCAVYTQQSGSSNHRNTPVLPKYPKILPKWNQNLLKYTRHNIFRCILDSSTHTKVYRDWFRF